MGPNPHETIRRAGRADPLTAAYRTHVSPAQGTQGQHLKRADRQRDVDAGSGLDPVDVTLPLVRNRGADVGQSSSAFESADDVARLALGNAEERDHGIALELIEHPAVIDHPIA